MSRTTPGVLSPTRTLHPFWGNSGWAVIRPELWETKICRPATLDECIGDFAPVMSFLQATGVHEDEVG